MSKPVEMPWAYATRKGWKPGLPTGNYFRYFVSRDKAEKSVEWMERKKRWSGPIEYRPGECQLVGYI